MVIGASSGGVEALRSVVSGLPGDLPAAVFVVVDLSEEVPSVLLKILDHAGPLEAVRPQDGEPIEKGRVYAASPDHHNEARMAGLNSAAAMENDYQIGDLSRYPCPECTGPLFEIREGEGHLRYRCRVGYAYTADSLIEENALYVALNSLEENADMARSLVKRSRDQNHEHAARRFEERARNMEEKPAVIRGVLTEDAADVL